MKRILTGMLAIVLFAGAAQAQDTSHHKGQKGHKNHRSMMMGKMNLSEDQKTRLKSINEARKNEIQALDKTALTADQRKAKMKELHEKYQGQVKSILTPEQQNQMKSFKEKGKGRKGFDKRGEGRGKMESLNLSDDQKSRMAKMRESYKGQFEAIKDNKSLTDEQRKEQMKALKQKQHEEMKSILTKEQAEKIQSSKKPRKETK